MASSRRSPGRVTTVPVTAIGSGARTADLFPIPLPLFLGARLVMWFVKRWYVFGALYFFTIKDSWLYTILFLVLAMALPFTYMWFNNRDHNIRAILVATYYWMRTRHRWRRAAHRSDLNEGPKVPKLTKLFPYRPPVIENDVGSSLTFTVDVSRTGATVKDIEENREQLTGTLRARRARIVRLSPGLAKITMEWDGNLSKSIVANPSNRIVSTQLPMAELDRDVHIELDTSILVVGESGSGKSNLTWDILNELNRFEIPYRIYAVDPKRVELADLADGRFTVGYADNPQDIQALIKKVYDDMMQTFQWMKANHLRQLTIDERNPLKILLIDELLMCGEEVKGDVTRTNLGQILISGRAAGYIVIGNSQLGQVDVLGRIRDLFPQRVCMAVKSSELTNAVLGPRAEERGARCTEITEKGVGYIFTDLQGTFQRFRPSFIQDTIAVANGTFYDAAPTYQHRGRERNRVCYTYELYGRTGVCLYIGNGYNVNDRLTDHQRRKPWFHEVDMSRTVIHKWRNKDKAEQEETSLISEKRPIYNIVGNHKN